jgi:hypothetical protein
MSLPFLSHHVKQSVKRLPAGRAQAPAFATSSTPDDMVIALKFFWRGERN